LHNEAELAVRGLINTSIICVFGKHFLCFLTKFADLRTLTLSETRMLRIFQSTWVQFSINSSLSRKRKLTDLNKTEFNEMTTNGISGDFGRPMGSAHQE